MLKLMKILKGTMLIMTAGLILSACTQSPYGSTDDGGPNVTPSNDIDPADIPLEGAVIQEDGTILNNDGSIDTFIADNFTAAEVDPEEDILPIEQFDAAFFCIHLPTRIACDGTILDTDGLYIPPAGTLLDDVALHLILPDGSIVDFDGNPIVQSAEPGLLGLLGGAIIITALVMRRRK